MSAELFGSDEAREAMTRVPQEEVVRPARHRQARPIRGLVSLIGETLGGSPQRRRHATRHQAARPDVRRAGRAARRAAPPRPRRRQADDRPVVRVGTEGIYPPFSFHDAETNDLTGYDIEVIKAVAKKAGWRLRVRRDARSTRSSPRSTPSASTSSPTRSRSTPSARRSTASATTYTYSRGVIVVKKGTKGIRPSKDLKGKTPPQSITTQLGRGRPQGRRQGPGRRGLLPGRRAGGAGSRRRAHQRQHRGARLPQHDRVGRDRDRRQRRQTRSASRCWRSARATPACERRPTRRWPR